MKKTADPKALRVFAEEIRVATLEELDSLGQGHVGGAMSIVETLAVLYGSVMNVVKIVYKCKIRKMALVTVEK